MDDDSELFEEINSYLKDQLPTYIFIYFMILNTVNQLVLIKQLDIIIHLKDLWSEKTVRKHLYTLRKKRYIKCETNEESRENFYQITLLGIIKLWQLKNVFIEPQFAFHKNHQIKFTFIFVNFYSFLILMSFWRLIDDNHLRFLLNFKSLIILSILYMCCIIIRNAILKYKKNKETIIYVEYFNKLLNLAFYCFIVTIFILAICASYSIVLQQMDYIELFTLYLSNLDLLFLYIYPISIIIYYGTQYIYNVKKGLIWLPPFFGGMIILITLLFPVAFQLNSNDIGTFYAFVWLWALVAYNTVDSHDLFFIQDPIMLYISVLSTILLFFCGIYIIFISIKIKKKEIVTQKAIKSWLIQGYLVILITIMYSIMIELWYSITFQASFWSILCPGHGIVGPVSGAYLVILQCKMLKRSAYFQSSEDWDNI